MAGILLFIGIAVVLWLRGRQTKDKADTSPKDGEKENEPEVKTLEDPKEKV